jgi:hypothetical protein
MEKSLEEIFKDEAFPAEDRPLPYSTPSVRKNPRSTWSRFDIHVAYDVFPAVKVGT